MDQKQIARSMEKKLINSAEANAEKIRHFFEDHYEVDIRNYEELLINEVNLYKEKELAELKGLNSQLNAKATMELRKELFTYRNGKVDELFTKIEKELGDFVNSDNYEKFLTSKWQELAPTITSGTIKVRAADEKLLAKIAPKMNIVVDDQIKIGGFICVSDDGKKEYNVTLDQALVDGRGWFEDSSCLTL
jgi:Archaeal/vacuolar-type H+-ATPase subunit E